MPTYEVEQYELHITKYRVQAASEAQAIVKVLNGTALPVDNSQEYVEVADGYGMPVEDHPEFAEALRGQGVPVDAVIPSIRSVEEVETD